MGNTLRSPMAEASYDILDQHDVSNKLTLMQEVDRVVQDEAEPINDHLETLIEESVTERQGPALPDRFRPLI
jgi:hypothetical protein